MNNFDYTSYKQDSRNIGNTQRAISAVSGSALLLAAVRNMTVKNDFSLKTLLSAVSGGYLIYSGLSGHCAVTSALTSHSGELRIQEVMTINKSPEEVYDIWRNLGNLPRFMKHLESVTQINGTISKWVAKIPGGIGTIEWEAKVLIDKAGSKISWESLPGAVVENSGIVEFKKAPGNRGTELNAIIFYSPPAGGAGKMVSSLFNSTFELLIREDIRRFKRMIETGEFVTVKGQPAAR